MDCYLLILYHLLDGGSFGREMKQFIPSSTFGKIYDSFWKKNYEKINDTSETIMSKWYSSEILRIFTWKLNNPIEFKNITMLGDGHDNRIDYSNKKMISNLKNNQLISFKNKKTCSRTQIFIDLNSFPIYVSKTKEPNTPDGSMLKDCDIFNIFTKNDCLGLDGGYYLQKNQIIEEFNKKGNSFSNMNFFFQLEKKKFL